MSEHVFRVRRYQRPLHEAWVNRKKDRLIEIAHRRWGKDEIALNATRRMAWERPASYWHCLPEFEQGRKALWTAVNPRTGKRRIEEAFPADILASRDEQSMFLRLKNGSTWQIVGSDRYNSLVGAGVAGVVFSEWALANPSAWGYMRPMVEENGGWAAFITTPRGNNHAKAMLDMARKSDRWFAEVSTISDTKALTAEQVAEALAEYQALYGRELGLAMFNQEYLCDFAGAMIGSYWGGEVNAAERDGRIKPVEIDWSQPVHTAWDLGKAVNNPVWCFQVIGGVPRIVDFYEPDSEDVADWVAWLNAQGYKGKDYVPHDIIVTEWGSRRTRMDVLAGLGRKPVRLPMVSFADGIQAGRETINKGWFHAGEGERAERVAAGVEGLRAMRREWDDERKTFRDTPVKDWAEHIGSAFRYLSLAWRAVAPPKPKPPDRSKLVYEVKDGRIQGNLTVREAVEAMVKRRKAGR